MGALYFFYRRKYLRDMAFPLDRSFKKMIGYFSHHALDAA
jgi:hypothetical protein